ncbi:GntR family transcriptional regulator [Fulvivirga sp. M361]|uniref:GntR family transcriptional regulator n=1 Tax=Fulvivirga sp. M361 TaxID=2594266 RepID=UPI00117A5859|nr:GntR family transcriptional regulator [Fulvivirga sp. M361]TRX59605.1 GntR family transcriptional regulator [Fulvivirga sp. M361]
MKLEIDHNSLIPLHIQAEELLRKMIAMPEYQEGKLLPKEINLARQLGISRNTLRQATNKLVYEGLLLRKKGVGTVVSQPVDSKAKNWMSFSQEMKSKGIEIVNYTIDLNWVVPPSEVLNFFGCEEEVKILKMERVRGNKKCPFVYFLSYFNPKIGLTGKEDFSRPLYDILEQDFSIVAKVSKEEITALAADPLLAKRLHIHVGEPILKRKRFVFDPGRRPIEYNIGYYKSDSIVYTVESEREF